VISKGILQHGGEHQQPCITPLRKGKGLEQSPLSYSRHREIGAPLLGIDLGSQIRILLPKE
ncbi:hypothetical protein BgiBS90_009047, partial [Biomphalaria glabrata]